MASCITRQCLILEGCKGVMLLTLLFCCNNVNLLWGDDEESCRKLVTEQP